MAQRLVFMRRGPLARRRDVRLARAFSVGSAPGAALPLQVSPL
jgi:hypothetical protein